MLGSNPSRSTPHTTRTKTTMLVLIEYILFDGSPITPGQILDFAIEYGQTDAAGFHLYHNKTVELPSGRRALVLYSGYRGASEQEVADLVVAAEKAKAEREDAANRS